MVGLRFEIGVDVLVVIVSELWRSRLPTTSNVGSNLLRPLSTSTTSLTITPTQHPTMSSTAKSRWAEDDPETEAAIAQRKAEKEAKKQAKAERQRKLEESQKKQAAQTDNKDASADGVNGDTERPTKRRRLSNEPGNEGVVEMEKKPSTLLRFPSMEWGPCRHVDNFEKLNHIEEGSYGWVSRAKEAATGEIIALKKLKMEYSYDGFPVTGLREIETLLESRHTNIVRLREIVLGDKMDE